MKQKADEFLEKAKNSSHHPERYAMFDITEKVTDIPSTWTVERAIAELGGTQLKAYLDETGLAGQIDLTRIIATDMSR